MEEANALRFNETEWLKMLFMISDMKGRMEQMERKIIDEVPIGEKRKLHKTTYHLSASTLAHIMERHYFKIQRHPDASKFTIPVHVSYSNQGSGKSNANSNTGWFKFRKASGCQKTNRI